MSTETIIVRNRKHDRVCISCGARYSCSVMATRKTRCADCAKKHRRRWAMAYNRRYRAAR